MKRVPLIGRVLDVVGLAVFMGGAGVAGWAWLGFERVRDFQPAPDSPPWAAMRLADGYGRLQQVGVGLMLLGAAVFVLAWWAARRLARPDASPVTEETRPG